MMKVMLSAIVAGSIAIAVTAANAVTAEYSSNNDSGSKNSDFFEAIAVMRPTAASDIYGTVTFFQSLDYSSVKITVDLKNAAPKSTHGLHMHTFGDVSDSKALAMGPHFNPFNKTHGCPDEQSLDSIASFHVGDLGNVQADANGTIFAEIIRAYNNESTASLQPDTAANILGHGVVLHEKPDDCKTQPVGNAGGRLSAGVIGWRAGTVFPEYGDDDDSSIDGEIPVKNAIAVLTSVRNTSTKGFAYFKQEGPSDVVKIHVELEGLEPYSEHGIHVHEYGDIRDTATGHTTGAHFNPYSAPHSCYRIAGSHRHAGDLGNVRANKEGRVNKTIVSELMTLYQGEIANVLGRAIVVTADIDDCVSQPSGNLWFEKRVAQGVIGLRNVTLGAPRLDQVYYGTGNSSSSSSSIISVPAKNIRKRPNFAAPTIAGGKKHSNNVIRK